MLPNHCFSIDYSIFRFKNVAKYFAQGILVTQLIASMTFKPTKYAKFKTNTKKYGRFDDIRFPQLRFHCKYYKKNEYRSECPEVIGNYLF